MKHTYTVEAETERELFIYTTALDRYCADYDFERQLRNLWKHGQLKAGEAKLVDDLWQAWHDTRANIGEVE